MNKRNIGTGLLWVVGAILLVIGIPASPQVVQGQQAVTVSMNPTDGPPGTVIVLQRSDSGPISGCTANGNQAGFTYIPIVGAGNTANYTVPQGASGSIDFDCVLFSIPEYVGTFRVTQPPPSPTPAPPNNPPPEPPPIQQASLSPVNGPPGTITTVSNPDPFRTLSCTVLGSNSVPIGNVDVSTAGGANYTVPTNIGDNLQIVFVCTPSAIGGETPTAQTLVFTIDTVCNPRTDWQFEYTVQLGESLFDIAQRFEMDHNFLCNANCDRIAVCSQIHSGNVLRVPTTPPPSGGSGTTSPVDNGIAPLDLDLYGIFTSCPELIPTADNMPAHHRLVGIAASNNPCESLFESIFGEPPYSPLSDEATRHMLQNCPQAGALLIGFLTSLAEWDFPLALQIDGQITPQNICDVAAAVAEQRRLPVTIAGVVSVNPSNFARLQSNDADLKYLITACVPGVDANRRDVALGNIQSLGITADDLYRDTAKCGFIKQLMVVGPRGTTPLETQFFDFILACSPSQTYDDVRQSQQFFGAAVVSGVDLRSVMSDPATCTNPYEVLVSHLPSFTVGQIQPDVPPQLGSCPDLARALQHFRYANGNGLSTYELWLILAAPDPCTAAMVFLRGGALPRPSLADPNCVIRHDNFVQATIILRDGTTLFEIPDTSSWQSRMRFVGRAPSRLCDPPDDLEGLDEAPPNGEGLEKLCVQASFALQNEGLTSETARLRIVSTDVSGSTPTHYAETAIISQPIVANGDLPNFTVTAFVNDRRGDANLQLNVLSDFGTLTDRTPNVDPSNRVQMVDRSECMRTFPAPIPPPPPRHPSKTISEPIAAPPVAAAPEPLEEPEIYAPLPIDTPTVIAAFVGTRADSTSEIYLWQSGSTRQFTSDPSTTKLHPAIDASGSRLAYLEIDGTTGVKLRVQPIEDAPSTPAYDFEGFAIEVTQLAWTPDNHILMTLRDLESGEIGIYEVDPRSESELPQPRLRIANAASPTISYDGQVIAFERQNEEQTEIWISALLGFSVQKITDHPSGVSCFDPAFGIEAMYFMCDVEGVARLYRYDAAGVLDVFQSSTAPLIDNPAPGPGEGYIAYDDGASIYLRRDTEDASIEELFANDNISNFSDLQWKAAFQAN